MFRYPAEWELQEAIWLTYPHNENEWGKDRLKNIREFYVELISLILDFQDVKLIFPNEEILQSENNKFSALENKRYKLHKIVIPNNDIWIRDYGPFFMKKASGANKDASNKIILDFEFNSWGGKFPPWDLDNLVPKELSSYMGLGIESYPMILEGGAVEFSGNGKILTTEQCLLNENRNKEMNKTLIESVLKSSFSVQEIIWLKRGLEGDHTDGHIDDFARFISENKIMLCVEDDSNDPNHSHLKESKNDLTEKGFEVIDLPMPKKMFLEGERLPNSYANFIYVNGGIILPLFNCIEDDKAKEIFKKEFPDRKIVGVNSELLIQEGGGLHCMTKQEPA